MSNPCVRVECSSFSAAHIDHPLELLQSWEIDRAASACRKHASMAGLPELRFNTISVKEPHKDAVLSFEAGTRPQPARHILCVVLTPSTQSVYEGTVELSRGSPDKDFVTVWTQVCDVQPLLTPDDNVDAEHIVKGDPGFQQKMRMDCGLEDLEGVIVDPWALHCPPPGFEGRRLMQAFIYVRSSPHDNEYAHPLDVVVIVDLNRREVVQLDAYKLPPSMPRLNVNYHRKLQTNGWRADLKPLHIVQPQGPSFSVSGNLVTWQKWRLRIGFDAREGLILHNVEYQDGSKLRPVMYRASLAEMAVPYCDPSYPYVRKCALDVGDYGVGFCTNSLQLGCDCLGHIQYLDAVVNNSRGEAVLIQKAVCMHEEDVGVLWKHYDTKTGHNEARRSRRLVISSFPTFQNYEYGIFWYLYQDGSIEFQVKLTGILSTSVLPDGVTEGERSPWGTLVAPRVLAANHQHFFCMRLDMSVDDPQGGKELVVSEVDALPVPEGPENPYGNAFEVRSTDLLSTHSAQRIVDPMASRVWKVRNDASRNPINGQAAAYKLIPGTANPLLASPNSLIAKRAAFATRNLWVTPYHPDQMYPAGAHVVLSKECRGLKVWTQEDVSLAGADPVVWYSFGVTHVPRIEDFPVMPVETAGFMLKPVNFFAWNPSLDLPPDTDTLSKECCGSACAPPQTVASKL